MCYPLVSRSSCDGPVFLVLFSRLLGCLLHCSVYGLCVFPSVVLHALMSGRYPCRSFQVLLVFPAFVCGFRSFRPVVLPGSLPCFASAFSRLDLCSASSLACPSPVCFLYACVRIRAERSIAWLVFSGHLLFVLRLCVVRLSSLFAHKRRAR